MGAARRDCRIPRTVLARSVGGAHVRAPSMRGRSGQPDVAASSAALSIVFLGRGLQRSVRGSTLDPPAAFGNAPNPAESGHGLCDSPREADEELVTRLTPLVYAQLRSIAHRQLRRERADLTMSTTDLVHNGYIRLAGGCRPAA